MRLKQRIEDFRVRELLLEEPREQKAEYRVYRVTKRKLTSIEAARRLAQEVRGVPADVSMAGLKDRQGVTIQHMAVRHGPRVSVRDVDLRIEAVGYCPEALTPAASAGNAFEVVVRGLDGEQLTQMRSNMSILREEGMVNYFDDQRFGNLRHGQGWIALDLMHGQTERGLRSLLTSTSHGDDPKRRAFKRALAANWGDWSECRDVAGRFGEHHSVFEHLKREPDDFAGAFKHIATRLRLIHLYSFQSHMWNRAVADFVRSRTKLDQRVVVSSLEGPLVFPEQSSCLEGHETFRIPGSRLEDVENEEQRTFLEEALATERLVSNDFHIEGVPGFGLKGEDRPLLVRPQHLRVRPAEHDNMNRGMRMVRVRFELPRGAYATLLVRRLLGHGLAKAESSLQDSRDDRPSRDHGRDRGDRPYSPRGDRPTREPRRESSGAPSGAPRGAWRDRPDRAGGQDRYERPERPGRYDRDSRGPRTDRREGQFAGRDQYASRDRAPEDRSLQRDVPASGRSGAWRPGHGLSGDEARDKDRAARRDAPRSGGGWGDRGPRRDTRDGDRRPSYQGRDDRPQRGDRGDRSRSYGDRRPYGGAGGGGSGGRPWEGHRGGPREDRRPGGAGSSGSWGDSRSQGDRGHRRPSHGGHGGNQSWDDRPRYGGGARSHDGRPSGGHRHQGGGHSGGGRPWQEARGGPREDNRRSGRDSYGSERSGSWQPSGGRGGEGARQGGRPNYRPGGGDSRDSGGGRRYEGGRDRRPSYGDRGGRSFDHRPADGRRDQGRQGGRPWEDRGRGGSDDRRPGRDARSGERSGSWQPGGNRGGSYRGDSNRGDSYRGGADRGGPNRGGYGRGQGGGSRDQDRGGSWGSSPRDASQGGAGYRGGQQAGRPGGGHHSGGGRSSWQGRNDRGSGRSGGHDDRRGGWKPGGSGAGGGWGGSGTGHRQDRAPGGPGRSQRPDRNSPDRDTKRPRYDQPRDRGTGTKRTVDE